MTNIIRRVITAGTEEKGDVLVTVSPGASGREITLEELPHPRFSSAVLETVGRVLDQENIKTIRVNIRDLGALDFVLEARLRAAVHEAEREEETERC